MVSVMGIEREKRGGDPQVVNSEAKIKSAKLRGKQNGGFFERIRSDPISAKAT